MVYIIGILGFIGGFVFGQMILYFMLRHKSKDELLNTPSIKWTYGLINWLSAGFGAWMFVEIYKSYFF